MMLADSFWLAYAISLGLMVVSSVAGFGMLGRNIWSVVVMQAIIMAILLLVFPGILTLLGGGCA